MDFFDRLETARARWNVLEHPFYVRWSAGELTAEELAFYAAEYRHAVDALATACEAAADDATPAVRADLVRHAAEERAHVDVWDRFAGAVGAEIGREPLPETIQCTRAWTAARNALEGFAILYTIESGQPAISQTKLDGLTEHYGVAAGSPASAYFTIHAELDHEHAAHSRALLEEQLAELDADRLLELSEAALRGNWALLDGVEQQFGR